MPTRVLREGIITSERVNVLTWPAEVFYRRLMSVVDDFGRYFAHPALLRAACYPLQLDKASEADVGKWLGETRKAALVSVYEVSGTAYLQLVDFRQQVRSDKSKYPPPPDNCTSGDKQEKTGCTADVKQKRSLDGDVDEGGGEGKSRKRPTRCPPQFEVSTEMARWAADAGLPADRVIPETEKFLDYWRGNGGTKLDWDATWRNWIRKAVEFGKRG